MRKVQIDFQAFRQQNGQAFSLVRFVFRYLIKWIRTRALRKRHSASFLAADRKRRKKQALAFSFLGATPSLPSGKNRTKKEWSPPTILNFCYIRRQKVLLSVNLLF